VRAEQIKIAGVIVIVEEGLRPPIAALGHVVRVTRKDGAGETSHEASLPRAVSGVKLVHCHRNPPQSHCHRNP